MNAVPSIFAFTSAAKKGKAPRKSPRKRGGPATKSPCVDHTYTKSQPSCSTAEGAMPGKRAARVTPMKEVKVRKRHAEKAELRRAGKVNCVINNSLDNNKFAIETVPIRRSVRLQKHVDAGHGERSSRPGSSTLTPASGSDSLQVTSGQIADHIVGEVKKEELDDLKKSEPITARKKTKMGRFVIKEDYKGDMDKKIIKSNKWEDALQEVKKESFSSVDFEGDGMAPSLTLTQVKCEKNKLVGGHVSISGGLWNAVTEATESGSHAFGLFLCSQRTWKTKPLEPESADKFRKACCEHGFSPGSILPHGSYLLNCGSPVAETYKKSCAALVEELQRCEQLGLILYNFHPGSTCGQIEVDACLDRIAAAINEAHAATHRVISVIENMSCQGNTVGGRFEDLRGIIDRVRDKARIGVCFDTCHAFAAGYDISTADGLRRVLDEFEQIVGLKYLKAVHLNDSKGKLGCHLDRHENIGKGYIGLAGFRAIMNEPRFDHLPMILETPFDSSSGYKKEIELLYSLCG
uniref:probable endonuclease 4 n=1 Tax=Myxine glutinosa TaxID=7769 RepID=UPI00358DEDC6